MKINLATREPMVYRLTMTMADRIYIRMNSNLANAIRTTAKAERRTASDMARLILERDAAVRKILTEMKTQKKGQTHE